MFTQLLEIVKRTQSKCLMLIAVECNIPDPLVILVRMCLDAGVAL